MPQVYGFRLVGVDKDGEDKMAVRVHHNCDSYMFDICSHDEECVDDGAVCAIPTASAQSQLLQNRGSKILHGLPRCVCDDEHVLKYLGRNAMLVLFIHASYILT